jgi:hypothetical protein
MKEIKATKTVVEILEAMAKGTETGLKQGKPTKIKRIKRG